MDFLNTLDDAKKLQYYRFMVTVTKNVETVRDLTPCWRSSKSLSSTGYGQIMIDNIHWNTHRFSWWIHNGCPDINLYEGKHVKHACDNKWCCNPEHLSMGTAQENMFEAIERGQRILKPKKVKQRVAVACNYCKEHTHLKCDDEESCAHCKRLNIICVREERKERSNDFKPGQMSGESNTTAKLTWEKVRAIRKRYAAGLRYGELKTIAEQYGVKYVTIQKIVHNKLWIEPEIKPENSLE